MFDPDAMFDRGWNALIVTCEHGGNRIPTGYGGLFPADGRVVQSHRGYDPGALELARAISRRFNAPLVASTTTRLLVDLNRSLDHRRLFSQYSRALDQSGRQRVLDRYYRPYRRRVESLVARQIELGDTVLHLSVHSFTPSLDGRIRRADVGLLYDPQRALERKLCRMWQHAIRQCRSNLRVRRNYPYLGTSDGLTTNLRRSFAARLYAGVELEINQQWFREGSPAWRQFQHHLMDSLEKTLVAMRFTRQIC